MRGRTGENQERLKYTKNVQNRVKKNNKKVRRRIDRTWEWTRNRSQKQKEWVLEQGK